MNDQELDLEEYEQYQTQLQEVFQKRLNEPVRKENTGRRLLAWLKKSIVKSKRRAYLEALREVRQIDALIAKRKECKYRIARYKGKSYKLLREGVINELVMERINHYLSVTTNEM